MIVSFVMSGFLRIESVYFSFARSITKYGTISRSSGGIGKYRRRYLLPKKRFKGP
jgi:hypothetical protein